MESVKDVEFDKAAAAKKESTLIAADKFKALANATLNAGTTVVGLKPDAAAQPGYVQKQFGPKAKELSDIGIKLKGEDVSVGPKATTGTKMKLSTSKWTPETCADTYEVARLCASNLKELPKFASAFGKMCESGIAAINSLSATDKDKTTAEDAVKRIRNNVSMVSKVATAVVSRTVVIPRIYISACAAVRSCSKTAAKKEEKTEE